MCVQSVVVAGSSAVEKKESEVIGGMERNTRTLRHDEQAENHIVKLLDTHARMRQIDTPEMMGKEFRWVCR